ncbi:MAG: hypothetical protein ACODUE_07150 [Synechococcus sp.]
MPPAVLAVLLLLIAVPLATSLFLHLIAWPLGILLLFVLVVVALANLA